MVPTTVDDWKALGRAKLLFEAVAYLYKRLEIDPTELVEPKKPQTTTSISKA